MASSRPFATPLITLLLLPSQSLRDVADWSDGSGLRHSLSSQTMQRPFAAAQFEVVETTLLFSC